MEVDMDVYKEKDGMVYMFMECSKVKANQGALVPKFP